MTELTQATLCVILNEAKREILLGLKKKHLFGGGNYNGPRGKVCSNETLEECAIRETREESSLIIDERDLLKVGEFTFIFPESQKQFNQVVHTFQVRKWRGKIEDSNEMVWRWFPYDRIPYEMMWDDDKFWLPQILKGKRLKGTFYFNEKRKVKSYDLNNL